MAWHNPHIAPKYAKVGGSKPTVTRGGSWYESIKAEDIYRAVASDVAGRVVSAGEALAQKGELTAILGLSDPYGVSSFLLTAAQAHMLTQLGPYKQGYSLPAHQFSSLSPIEIHSIKDLEDLMREYKSVKGRVRAELGTGTEQRAGLLMYEQSRLMIRHITGNIDAYKFSSQVDQATLQNIPIFSVALTRWNLDNRKMTDIAWTLSRSPESMEDKTAVKTSGAVTSYLLQSLQNPGGKPWPKDKRPTNPLQIISDFETQVLDTHSPAVILLVFGHHTEDWFNQQCPRLQVKWVKGIGGLINPQGGDRPSRPSHRSRSRSRSPSRRQGTDSKDNVRARDYAPPGPTVHVVDVREMFTRMSTMEPKSIPFMLEKLDSDDERCRQALNSTDTCRMLYDAWLKMSQGPSHIEMRLALNKKNATIPPLKTEEEKKGIEEPPAFDEEEDPDDGQTTVRAVPQMMLNLDEDDFGDSDSD